MPLSCVVCVCVFVFVRAWCEFKSMCVWCMYVCVFACVRDVSFKIVCTVFVCVCLS